MQRMRVVYLRMSLCVVCTVMSSSCIQSQNECCNVTAGGELIAVTYGV
jgi:hypothetical protein